MTYSLTDLIGKLTAWLVSERAIPEQPPLSVDPQGWLVGAGVTIISAHLSWLGHAMTPKAAVVHSSDTRPGTAINMAKRRSRKFGLDANDRMASWHASIEQDGSLVQLCSFLRTAWHAGSDTAKQIPGIGWANYHAAGFELIGVDKFTEAQVFAYARLLRAFVKAYGVKREHAFITHASLDPKRRKDPPEWVRRQAERILEYAYR